MKPRIISIKKQKIIKVFVLTFISSFNEFDYKYTAKYKV